MPTVTLRLLLTSCRLHAARPSRIAPVRLDAQALPTIAVLATGGTIAGAAATDVQAGYTSGQVGVEQLIAAVPQAKKLATLRASRSPTSARRT